jgi:hypothetical protein
MRNFFISLLVCGLLSPSISRGAENTLSDTNKPTKSNVVLDVTPIRVKPLKEGKGVDALEKPPGEMGPSAMIVVFRINRIVRGELAPLKTKELSVWDQAKDAADDKNILKLVTMDFHRPEEEGVERTSFSMVVADPYASFGIREGEDPPKQRYRISLARTHKKPDSYLLVKNEKV